MPTVQRRDAGDAKSFGDRDDARVGTTEGKVRVTLHEFSDALPVRRGEVLDDEVTVRDRAVKRGLGGRTL